MLKNMPRLSLYTALLCLFHIPAYAQFSGELLWWVSQRTAAKEAGEAYTPTPTPAFDGKDKNPFPVNKAPVKIQRTVQVVEPVVPKVDYRQIEANKVLKEIRTYMARNQVLLPNVEDILVEGFLQGANGSQAIINGNWRIKGDQVTVTSNKHQKFSALVDRLAELSPALMESLQQDLRGLEEQSNAFLLEIVTISPGVIVLKDSQNKSYQLKF